MPSNHARQKCGKCHFYDPMETSVNNGLCRLQPPIVMPVHFEPKKDEYDRRKTKPFTSWPVVRGNEDWCGDFEERK
jgi:hypothetical protein